MDWKRPIRWVGGLAAILSICLAPALRAQESAPESEPSGPGQGEIIFSTGAAVRPPEGRHQVQPQQTINVCLKLNAEEFPFFTELKEGLLGYRIILEDSATPPHVMTINPGTRLKRMAATQDGCYSGTTAIPQYLPSGVYHSFD